MASFHCANRVQVIKNGEVVAEYWADNWTSAEQDDGKTVKVWGSGDGKKPREQRLKELQAELAILTREGKV